MVEYHLTVKKNDVLTHATTWMGLENFKVNETTTSLRALKRYLSVHILKLSYFLICLPLYYHLLHQNPPAMQEMPVQFLGWEDPLEKG